MEDLKKIGVRVKYDNSDNSRPGWKFAEYEMKGVPVRLTIGPKDLENNSVEVARRDTKEKTSVSLNNIHEHIAQLLEDIQNNMYNRAKEYLSAHITDVNNWDEFINVLDNTGGFANAHWDGTPETEGKIKELSKATIRCVPFQNQAEAGSCILTGKPSTQRVLFARAY